MTTAADVAEVLLGTWPSQVATWGRSGIAAYLAEIEARGVTPEQALVALRSYDGEFPPPAGKLAKLARQDSSLPSGAEVVRLLWDTGGVMWARDRAGAWASTGAHALADEQAILIAGYEANREIGAFLTVYGVRHLRQLDPYDPQWGEVNRKKLVAEWEEFCEVSERREVAALVGGRRGELDRIDPQKAIGR